MPSATIPKRYGVKGWGRKGFATPTPFATVPIRYGVGLRAQPSLWTPFTIPKPFAKIPMKYGVKGWGRKGFVAPMPFATVSIRYGVKGWGRKLVKSKQGGFEANLASGHLSPPQSLRQNTNKGWGRKGFARPMPFATIPIRYGVKGWERKLVKSKLGGFEANLASGHLSPHPHPSPQYQ
uniref:Uncharacterized protein n=1 Tax=Oryza rufipogon TaxID=4529 RepID=A0A0E0P4J0_ORYRU